MPNARTSVRKVRTYSAASSAERTSAQVAVCASPFGHTAGRTEFVLAAVCGRDDSGRARIGKVGKGGSARVRPLVLAEGLEMRPLVAHCHFALAKLDRRRSMREESRTHLVTAITLYCEMGIQFWLEQAQAEMRELA